MIERRASKFTERLSTFMVMVAAFGAFIVLLDPKVTLAWVVFNGDGFSADLKGAVISAILIGGWTAVKEYWLGASAAGAEQGKSLTRIAEAAAPATAQAVAASRSDPVPPMSATVPTGPIVADTVMVEANLATITQPKESP